MSELQKLSLKKLRKMHLPLFVLDRKSKKGGFVIQELGTLVDGGQNPKFEKSKKTTPILDYRALGLLWDRPQMTNEAFHRSLKSPQASDHLWAARRFLERVPSTLVKETLSLGELKEIFSKLSLRPFLQEAWSHALHYWSETAPRHS